MEESIGKNYSEDLAGPLFDSEDFAGPLFVPLFVRNCLSKVRNCIACLQFLEVFGKFE